MLARREVLAGLGATAALAACRARPETTGDVFAAGQPAAILLLALAPERLIGWPRRPLPAALAVLGAEADKPQVGALTAGGTPASLEAVAALRPAMIFDYGDPSPSYRALGDRVERRLGVPAHLLDGALRATPEALTAAGALLGVEARAARLADAARATLAGWSKPPGTGPTFFYARGDGGETGFTGSLATESLEGAGWTNVAVGGTGIGRVGREQVAAWDPEVVATLDPRFAARAASDPFWSRRRGGAQRRVLLLPDLPFGWIDRPPSINRLLGCAWLGGGDAGALAALLWGVMSAVGAPRWLA